jgi:hypothetical protein
VARLAGRARGCAWVQGADVEGAPVLATDGLVRGEGWRLTALCEGRAGD